jgi:hypothetical protein
LPARQQRQASNARGALLGDGATSKAIDTRIYYAHASSAGVRQTGAARTEEASEHRRPIRTTAGRQLVESPTDLYPKDLLVQAFVLNRLCRPAIVVFYGST